MYYYLYEDIREIILAVLSFLNTQAPNVNYLNCLYSQTCDQQPPKEHDKTGCLRQVAADHRFHDLVGFIQVLSVHIYYM